MIRNMNPSDYNQILLPWFAGYDWSPVPVESLPKNCYIYELEGKPRVFTCYYSSDSNIAIIGYTIANPYLKVTEEELLNCLQYVLDEIKKAGFSYVHYSTGKGGIGIVRKLKKLGMSVTCGSGYIMGMSVRNNSIEFLQED